MTHPKHVSELLDLRSIQLQAAIGISEYNCRYARLKNVVPENAKLIDKYEWWRTRGRVYKALAHIAMTQPRVETAIILDNPLTAARRIDTILPKYDRVISNLAQVQERLEPLRVVHVLHRGAVEWRDWTTADGIPFHAPPFCEMLARCHWSTAKGSVAARLRNLAYRTTAEECPAALVLMDSNEATRTLRDARMI